MAENRDVIVDPFRLRDGVPARLAGRLHCTEGQLYTFAIGVLLTWVVSANALPHVVWDASGPSAAAFPRVPVTAPIPATSVAPQPAPVAVPPPLPPIFAAPDPLPNPLAQPSSGAGSPEPTPFPGPSETPDAGPVRVTGGGYAAASAGTPLATLGVPDGSVAVSLQGGQPEKVTYLHLAGGGSPLELVVDPNGTNSFDSLAALTLCTVIPANWQVGQGDVAVSDAPEYDCAAPITGTRSTAGDRWTFDVSKLDPARIAGVAIVPSAEALVPSYQVVFRLSGSGA